MAGPNAIPDRRKLFDLRALIEFLAESILQQKLTTGESISEIYRTIHTILKESKDLSVSGELLTTFETNRKVIEEIYNKDGLQNRTLSAPLLSYFDKVVEMKDRLSNEKDALKTESEKPNTTDLDSFIREYVVIPIKDSRIVFLLLVTVIYRQMQNLSTRGFTEGGNQTNPPPAPRQRPAARKWHRSVGSLRASTPDGTCGPDCEQ